MELCFRVLVLHVCSFGVSRTCNLVAPLSPDIKMHILLTVLHTFLVELVRRICLNIKTSYPW